MNLHSLWDGGLITKAVRELSNYTTPLPSCALPHNSRSQVKSNMMFHSPQIENNLRGTIYDPYIRLILWEGVRKWWRSELFAWLECPSPLSAASLSSPSRQLLFANSATSPSSPTYDVVCPETWAQETHKITCELPFPADYDSSAPKELNTPEYYGPIRGARCLIS